MLENISRKTGVVDTLREIMSERADRERLLTWRYPWFNMFYNYFVAFFAVLLVVSLIWWSGNVKKDQNEAARQEEQNRIKAEEIAKEEEARKAEEERLQKEFEEMFERWVEAGGDMLYGIRNFIELYHYTEKDIETYLRCAWNRYLYYGKLTDLAVLIYTPDQFVACDKGNPPLKEYKEPARRLFAAWMNETELPCDPSYIYAELTPDGVFLTKEFGADGYARRWQAS